MMHGRKSIKLLWRFYFDSVVAGRSVVKWRKVGAIAWALRGEEAEQRRGNNEAGDRVGYK
jgi:hypothetical protein